MALFSSDLKETVKRLANKEFNSTEERDEMLTRLATSEGVRAKDVVWMLFRPDRALRDAGVKILAKVRDAETVDVFIGESKSKPEAAMRAAVATLFTLGIPGVEARLAQLMAPADKETKDTREQRELAQKIILEAPMSKTLEPILWQLESSASEEERVLYLNKLATGQIDERALPRWQKLARDGKEQIRDKALELLATQAPASSIPLFVDQLPTASYAVQQMIVGALTRAAAGKGPEFADQLLPLIASGEAAT
ncbi:MAG: hypothetical protein JWO97_3763, partial [Acidobacteria bacterium]|nr:hypothetical protein [Acidobacteriota bacterium]